jgi:hypothetical protein
MGKILVLKSAQSVSLIKKDVSTASLTKRDISPVALILGNQPINTIAPVITGIAQRGETLTSTTGTWTGTGTISFAYQWQRNEVNISGATSSTYMLVADDDNTSITCVVSATDSEGTGTATSNAISPILGIPYNLVAPVASGTAQVGQTLSTTNGGWQGIATITFTYQWRRDAGDISGATSSTYTLVADDYATDIDCVVTATNTLGSANQDSNDIANIAGSVPVISGVPTISGTAKVDEILTATAASVTGTPTPTDTFQWQRSDDGGTGWANISGATSTTYTAVLADEGKYLRVVQTSTNEAGSDTANSASTAQVASAFEGLLDNYGQNIGAAYSVRLLSSTYEGNCMEIRRDSDNATQNIGFSNNVLDTSAIATFCSGTNGYVRTWYDQSGNDKNVQQTTATKQPRIFYEGSVVTLNGKPALDGYVDDGGNAADQHLQVVESGEVQLEADSSFDIFMVMQFDNFYGFGFSKFPGTGLNDRTLFYNNQLRFTIDSNNLSFSKPSGQIDLRTTQILCEYYNDTNSLQPYINGSTYNEAGSLPENSVFNFNNIGTNNNQRSFQYAQEVLIYTAKQDSRDAVTNNINTHFEIYE